MAIVSKLIIFLLLCIYHSQGWFFKAKKTPTVCFHDLQLGCFPVQFPFINTKNLARDPKLIGVKFKFFITPTVYHTLDLKYGLRRIRSRNVFKPELKTKVIIHGFQDRGDNKWVKNMVTELLKVPNERMNVLVVDWRRGASVLDYNQAVADIRVVGAMLARLLTILEGVGADPGTFHLIGHSLGAHIAGHAGRRNGNVGRITGLDPAGPSFENENAVVRLDSTDAIFVDVLHTDIEPFSRMGLGIKEECGHVDFYPNGGLKQPGCPAHISYMIATLLTGRTSFVGAFACSHMRAVELFTESINTQCRFQVSICPSKTNITQSACTGCPSTGCPRMGYHADARTSGVYFLPTNAKHPYCQS